MKRLLDILLVVILASGLSFVLLTAQTTTANPGNINVPGDYSTIQEAIDAALLGDTVTVEPGIYNESITMKSGVAVQGAGANVTTIDGGGSGSVVTGADNSTISGFTITGGMNGIYNYYSSPTITSNIIHDNPQYGIHNSYSSPTIANNIITSNNYGIHNSYSSPTIANNIITSNNYGINNSYSSPVITNNTIASNSGRGISNYQSSSLTITNNIITGGQFGIAIRNSNPIINNNDVFSDLGANYWDFTAKGPFDPGVDDISLDPLFVDADNGDYHLLAESPCIDAGSNAAVPSWLTEDFEGDSRKLDGDGDGNAVVDMGADELINTPKGTDVTVSFDDEGVQLTFAEVTTPGETSVSTSETGPEIPSGFLLAGFYYDISTTAIYSGNITIRIPYDSGSISGSEEDLRLYHFDGMDWQDVTTFVNTVDNIICGKVSSLSIFAPLESPLVCPMSEFKIEYAKIDFRKKPGDDKIRVRGELELDLDNGDGVVISDDVTVTVGSLSETITMKERGRKGEKWEYKRPKDGEGNIQHMIINWKNGKFSIRMDNVDMSGVTNPVTISIQIGDDFSEETIQMREKKHHWDYKSRNH